MPTRLMSLYRSPAIRSAAGFAAGGIGFALGNILLARTLVPVEFGRFVLFLALTYLGIILGPLGLETVINRHRLTAFPGLLRRALATSATMGVVVAAASVLIYKFELPLAVMLIFSVTVASMNRIGASFMQAQSNFRASMWLLVVHNWTLILAVPVLMLLEQPAAIHAAAVIACGYSISGILGWRAAWSVGDAIVRPEPGVVTREGLAVAGLNVCGEVFRQLDRLLIPRLLSVAALGTYSLGATVAGSAFHMLQAGAGHTLTPQLRACRSKRAVLTLLRREASMMFGLAALAAIGVCTLAPWFIDLVFAERYEMPRAVIYAIVLLGVVKIWHQFAAVCVTALGTTRHLLMLHLSGWIALTISAVMAVALSRYGMASIILGIAAGWSGLAIVATFIASQSLNAWVKSRAEAMRDDETLTLGERLELRRQQPTLVVGEDLHEGSGRVSDRQRIPFRR